MKRCTKCLLEKDIVEFSPSKTGRNGLFAQCKSCCVLRAKAWAIKHPKRALAKSAKYYAENRDRYVVARRKNAAENPDRERNTHAAYYDVNSALVKKRVRTYKTENSDKVLVDVRNRKARQKGALGRHTVDEIAALLVTQNHCCANPYCSADLNAVEKHLDHKTPISCGGSNSIENLQWLCATCNLRKNAKDNATWLAIVAQESVNERNRHAPNIACGPSQGVQSS